MAGMWSKLWDEERQKWIDVYVNLPDPGVVGAAWSTVGKQDAIVLGPDGKPVTGPPSRRIGFVVAED